MLLDSAAHCCLSVPAIDVIDVNSGNLQQEVDHVGVVEMRSIDQVRVVVLVVVVWVPNNDRQKGLFEVYHAEIHNPLGNRISIDLEFKHVLVVVEEILNDLVSAVLDGVLKAVLECRLYAAVIGIAVVEDVNHLGGIFVVVIGARVEAASAA